MSIHRAAGAGPADGAARGYAPACRRLAGDEPLASAGALDELYRRHQPMVYRYCLGMLRKPDAAADAAQSTWMQATAALSAPDTVVRNVRAWLRTIARNECLDVLRAATATRTHDISTLELSAGPTPEASYEIREQLQTLLGDLHTLSERQRSALVLRELCGLSAGQLADEFQTTPQRASGLVADARRTLAQRKAGRLLDCTDVCDELSQGSQRSIGVRAHLEVCASCESASITAAAGPRDTSTPAAWPPSATRVTFRRQSTRQMHERLPARAQSVPVLRRAANEFAAGCGASGRQLSSIALAVSEAVGNVVVHAYVGQQAPGIVDVDAQIREQTLQVTVCDEGIGMRSRTDSPGLGLGLALIASMSDHSELTESKPGVQVRMMFAIA